MIRKLLAAMLFLLVVLAIAGYLFARGAIGGEAVRRTLEQQLSARVGQPVTIGRLGAAFVPRVALELHEVAVGAPAAATIGQLSFGTGLRGLFARRVEDAEVVIANARIPVEMALAIVGALSSSTEPGEGSGVEVVSVRTLAFRQVELVASPRSLTIDLESALTGDRLDVTRLVAQSQGTRLEAHGAVSSIAARSGRFTAAASRLNLDEILAVASGLSTSTSPGAAASSLNLTVDLTAPGGELAGYTFESLACTLEITPARLQLEPLRFGIFGGEYDGHLRVTPSGAAPLLALNGRVKGIDMGRLLREMGGSSSMSGTLAGNLAATAQAGGEMLRTARGTGKVSVTDGEIPGLEMVRSVVLAFGRPSGLAGAGAGSAFRRIAGSFSLADQTLRSDDVTFESVDFDMSGRTVVELPGGAIEMHADIILSRELTAQAGTDLRRYAQEDGQIVVPAVITGTVAAPRVTLDVAAAANRALRNEVKERVRGLLDRIIR